MDDAWTYFTEINEPPNFITVTRKIPNTHTQQANDKNKVVNIKQRV